MVRLGAKQDGSFRMNKACGAAVRRYSFKLLVNVDAFFHTLWVT